MGVVERLSRFVAGSTGRELIQALQTCYSDSLLRAQLLLRHAQLAPQSYSREVLRQLGGAEEAQAERLRQALVAVGAAIPSVSGNPLPSRAVNHWGRLVHNLEAHRAAFRRLRELAVQFAEPYPSTAELFDQLCREEHRHCEQLRSLIARADPQALD